MPSALQRNLEVARDWFRHGGHLELRRRLRLSRDAGAADHNEQENAQGWRDAILHRLHSSKTSGIEAL